MKRRAWGPWVECADRLELRDGVVPGARTFILLVQVHEDDWERHIADKAWATREVTDGLALALAALRKETPRP